MSEMRKIFLLVLALFTAAFAVDASIGCSADIELQDWKRKIAARLVVAGNTNAGVLHQEAGYALYNQGVIRQTAGNNCCAVDFYLRAIEIFPVFPEACQNVANIFDTGCIDIHNRSSILHKDPSLARHYHEQSGTCLLLLFILRSAYGRKE
jgi:hypothetical protein